MATEHTTERTDGVTTERSTVVSDSGAATARSGGGMGLIATIIGLALVALLAWFLINQNRQGEAQTEAVTGAAEQVGDAASGAANAVGDAAREATN
jgi:hypothetical protein